MSVILILRAIRKRYVKIIRKAMIMIIVIVIIVVIIISPDIRILIKGQRRPPHQKNQQYKRDDRQRACHDPRNRKPVGTGFSAQMNDPDYDRGYADRDINAGAEHDQGKYPKNNGRDAKTNARLRFHFCILPVSVICILINILITRIASIAISISVRIACPIRIALLSVSVFRIWLPVCIRCALLLLRGIRILLISILRSAIGISHMPVLLLLFLRTRVFLLIIFFHLFSPFLITIE